jgi:5'-nucleotidase
VAATRSAGAQIALTNPFGIRAALLPATDGAVTYGELYKIQPFNSVLITQTLTGAQLKAVLEQGFDDNGLHQALSPSSALHYTVDFNRPIGARVVRITIAGKPMVPGARYRVTVNNFLAMGAIPSPRWPMPRRPPRRLARPTRCKARAISTPCKPGSPPPPSGRSPPNRA